MKSKLKGLLLSGRALRLVWDSGASWMIANAILVVLQAVIPVISLYLMKGLIDAITQGIAARSTDSVASAEAISNVTIMVILAGVVALAGYILRSLSTLVTEAQAQVVSNHMQDILHEKSVSVDLSYYENPAYYDTLHRAQREAPFRPVRIVNGLMQFAQNTIILLSIGGLLVLLNPVIALILVISTIPAALVRLRYSNRLYRWQWKQAALERRFLYYDWMLIDSGHAKEIRLFNLGDLFIKRTRDLREQIHKDKLSITTRRTMVEIIAHVLSTGAMYTAYATVAFNALGGQITLGDVVMVLAALQRGQSVLQELLANVASLYEDNLFLNNLYEFLDIQPRIHSPEQPKPIPTPLQKGIQFENISFHYGDDDRKALQDVSLNIPAGKITALVGENGSGKTTLIKLLCRLYDPVGGKIMMDGVNIRDFDVNRLRENISVIFQDYTHYNLTVKENIGLGNLKTADDMERITKVSQESGAHPVIEELKNGYNTVLGKWFEDGTELSIGEWQKVALARALLRDGQIIVLDEPTSAMDAKAEFEVFERIRDIARGRTVILISHRMSTVQLADFIYMIADGEVVESGTHDELLKRSGQYAFLYQAQAQRYTSTTSARME